MSGPTGEILNDIIATSIPPQVAAAHGKNSFALEDGRATEDPNYAKRASVDVEAVGERTLSVIEREQYPIPTEEEARDLRKIAGHIPTTAYMLCLVEFAERASYYGVQTIFSNFLQFPLPKGGNGAGAPPRGTQETAGALGYGEQTSVALNLLFIFLAYLIPIPGAWLADTKLGRYKVIIIGVIVCGVSHIIMICGAIPSLLQAGKGVAPFMVSFFLLAIGAGLFKPNVAPVVLDQYKHQKPYTKLLTTGEKVVVDPEATVQRVMLIFYALVNVGAFFALATTYCEKYVGYWLAFLAPGILYFLLPVLLWYLNNKLIKYSPDGTVLNKVWKVLAVALKENRGNVFRKDFWETAKPSYLADKGVTQFRGQPISWTNKDVEDIQRTFIACMIFLYFPIWNLNDGGIGNVLTAQGAALTTNGAPNDLLSNFNPLTIIVTVPLLSHVIYPGLRRHKIKFGRITRITFGFTLAWVSGIFGAVVQYYIYKTSPCGWYASTCEIGTGVSPITIWVQIPNVALGAISECFCNVTAYEIAYARSPPGMKALVMSLFLANTALSSALGELVTPAMVDPYLIWVWAAPAIALFVQTVIFWFRYKKYNDDEFMTYEAKPELNEKVLEHRDDVDVPETITEERETVGTEKQG